MSRKLGEEMLLLKDVGEGVRVVVIISRECPLVCGACSITSWDWKKYSVKFHGNIVS